ncbi:CYTH and CHAD domain-containing protein [Nocardioides sp. REDSEA-S30_B4]|uniref:CYTH and CHAD domain-containing protein n=1 Tax=Nocardioides sp. REDSEA-S30_B4 TaxID=1811552 RepID=UPI0025ECFBD7|nr:CYTH and CHAD domain-containing protein [Nocardioides sp. REDSEA-S30_B4]
MSDHHEIERTFTVDSRTTMPDLAGVGAVASVGPPDVVDLEAAYLDTADLALVRAGITLRRRSGGGDEGWHLKLPVGAGRDEVHQPLGEPEEPAPDALRDLVRAYTGGQDLGVVATISTRRTTTALLGDDGAVLAEVCDDEVTGRLPDGPTMSWREWEVELVDGDVDLLDLITDELAEEGVVPARTQRKIEAVLGDRLHEPARPRHPLIAYLADQVDDLRTQDVAVRRGDLRGVHQARVACRRMRAALAAYRPLVETEATEPVREELRWLGHALSDTRDAVVARELLMTALDAEDPALVHGPVRERIDSTYEHRTRAGIAAAVQVLDGERYAALLEELRALVEEPPLRLEEAPSEKAMEAAWHEVRKAAKRLRYAAEVARPGLGKPAKQLAERAKEATQVLGERQDTVVAREHLLALADDAGTAGEPTFTYGLLHARQEALQVELAYRAWETLDMLKSGTRIAGVAVRLK